MLYSTGQVGIRVYPMLNYLIIIATRKVLRWHHLKCCMAESAGHHYFEIKQGKPSLWTRSFAIGGETGTNNKAGLEGHSLNRKAMLTREEGIWCLRLVILFISKFHL